MGFAGNLRTLAFPEVMQTLNRIRATGVLSIAAGDRSREVVFDQGEILGVEYRAGAEKQVLLQRLILAGQIDAVQAAEISSSGHESGVVARLIDQGLVTDETVREARLVQAEEEVYDLFTLEFADFVFHDAGPEQPEVEAKVARHREAALGIQINSILMEAARRQDEFNKLRQVIVDGGIVPGIQDQASPGIAEASASYPGSAVVGLIDAVRSVDDIVKDSVASRHDVYSVLVALMEKREVVPLTRDDITFHGDHLAKTGDHGRAAILYRRALAAKPADRDVARKLAECMSQVGDTPEAAAGYAQLAIAELEAGEREAAIAAGRKAVELAPAEAQPRIALVRCLLAGHEEAGHGSRSKKKEVPADPEVEEAALCLDQLADIYIQNGQLEDGRATCLKTLSLLPGHEPARRRLARVFSTAARDDAAEDVVVCIECGQVNHREAAKCEKCQASLQLACLACGRVVGVSDRLCIFCGAHPHAGVGTGKRIAAGSPTTSRLVNPDKLSKEAKEKGTAFWKAKLQQDVGAARMAEESGDFENALRHWREVAKVQVDNAELLAHIRELELRLHDTLVERAIEEGHRMRRIRRFWSAVRCYRQALRVMPSDDPRAPKLAEMLHATQRTGQVIALVYVAAGLLLVVVGWMALRPYLVERDLRREMAVFEESLAAGAAHPEAAPLNDLDQDLKRIEDSVASHGDGARWRRLGIQLTKLRGDLGLMRQRAASKELDTIQALLDQKDLAKAKGRMEHFLATFKDLGGSRGAHLEERLGSGLKAKGDLESRIAAAPGRLASAKDAEKQGRLAEALAAFRALTDSPNEAVSAEAKAAVARLTPLGQQAQEKVEAALAESQRLVASDLARAEQIAAAVVELARPWALAAAPERQADQCRRQREQAAVEARGLGPEATLEQLAGFLRTYSGAAEAEAIRARHDVLKRQQDARADGLARYRRQVQERRWEQAWQSARSLHRGFPGAFTAAEAPVPLVVETRPVGALVSVDGREAGRTPCVLSLAPDPRGEVVVSAPGFVPVRKPLAEAITAWRWDPELARAQAWRAALGRAASQFAPLPDGSLVVSAGDAVAMVGPDGRVRWRQSLGAEELADPGQSAMSHPPMPLGDGRWAVGAPGRDLAIIDAEGRVGMRWPSAAAVRGRPLVYTNDVMGAGLRVAAAAEALYAGDPDGKPIRIPLPRPAIAGPLAVAKDLDRILVVADVRGMLLGVEESTRRVAWSLDLKASEVGQLHPLGDGQMAALLDGGRLACVAMRADAASLRWSQPLPAPAVGEPAVAGGQVAVACGAQVLRFTAQGVALPPLALPAPASAPPAVAGDWLAAVCADGQLAVFRDGQPMWTTACGARPTGVAITRSAVVAALADGSLVAFSP